MKRVIAIMLLVLGIAISAGAQEPRFRSLPDTFYRKDGKVYLTTSSKKTRKTKEGKGVKDKGVYVGIGPQYIRVNYNDGLNDYFPRDFFGDRIFVGEYFLDRFALEGSFSSVYGRRYKNDTDVEAWALMAGLDIIFSQPFTESASCYLLLGINYAYAEWDEDGSWLLNDDSIGFNAGAGVEVDVIAKMFIKGDYRYQYMDDLASVEDVHALNLGFGFRW